MTTTASEEEICFYHEIGAAITEWAKVEDSLRHTMLTKFKDEDLNRESLSLGFFAIENFRSKLEYADMVVQRKIVGSPNMAEWVGLVDRTRKASFKRNKLAHMRVREIPKAKPGRRIALEPWIVTKAVIAAAGDTKPRAGGLCLRDIVSIRNEFFALVVAWANFRARLNGAQEPHAKSLEQPARPQTIDQIKRQILGGFAVPQKPLRKKS